MEYRTLGRSGVKVSSLCVGTMTWAAATDEETAYRIMDVAMDSGVNFFDTANGYSAGKSEEILGRAMARDGKRDQLVIATKFTCPMGKGPNDGGSSRYHLMRQCEASLKRLGTDRIDLYYVHYMDMVTPVDEILRGLDDLVRQGKVNYVGSSKFVPSLLSEAICRSGHEGWARIVAEQPPYNLLDRSIEKELIWTCLRHGVGICPWAPLATGMLSGRYTPGATPPEDSRGAKGGINATRLTDEAMDRAEQLKALATARGLTLAQFALAWIRQQPAVTAPILGARTVAHLESALATWDVRLTAEEMDQIDVIVPPGSAVSRYWEANTFDRLRPEMLKHRVVA